MSCTSRFERRELDTAIGIAKDIARERRPIGLELALGLVSLVAAEGDSYDAWASRWLERWLNETPGTSIALVAEVAATLADLPAEPQGVEAIRETCSAQKMYRLHRIGEGLSWSTKREGGGHCF